MKNLTGVFARCCALGLLLVLGGCATISPEECNEGLWYERGLHDGSRGVTEGHIYKIAQACQQYGAQVDTEAWLAGREQGLESYCTPENAFRIGRVGGAYHGVCAFFGDDAFLRELYRGRSFYEREHYARDPYYGYSRYRGYADGYWVYDPFLRTRVYYSYYPNTLYRRGDTDTGADANQGAETPPTNPGDEPLPDDGEPGTDQSRPWPGERPRQEPVPERNTEVRRSGATGTRSVEPRTSSRSSTRSRPRMEPRKSAAPPPSRRRGSKESESQLR
ncbi:DUF2799 domain-containing protein [Biformimicrobium ophioploci]|uniref:DUF2799 domain-containing protein n=1 Tax=Biformimicrobium ophioploci TaxID=3036711 RepID=A0ABQ6M0U1_9GAMM|nr:DUF2799 domain-containing protein [Microbulbifer sp. NKW57]GMG87973.1 hypothetical protein MNKW57_22940 [Microbulbifer sp. NKW57]